MSTLLNSLLEQRARLWEETKRDLDTHTAASYNEEAEAKFSKQNADLDKLDERIADVRKAEARATEAEGNSEPLADAAKRNAKPEGDLAILRAMSRGELVGDIDGKTGRRGYTFKPTDEEKRTLLKGQTTTGGFTVPTSFYGQLVEHMVQNSAIRETNVTVLTTDAGEDLQVPKTTTHPTAIIIGEGGTITASDPVFGQVTLGAFKYGFSTGISFELEQDTGVALDAYLARIGGEALGNGSGAHFVTGSGSGQPNGAVTAASPGVTGGTGVGGAFTADNIIDLYFSVAKPYRVRSYWMMQDGGMKTARKLKDADSQYLLALGGGNGLRDAENWLLLDRPVVNDPNMATPNTAAKSVLFGDFSRYFIRDVNGVRVERSADFKFDTDIVTWRFLFRTDGDLVDTNALRYFIGGAT